MAAAVRSVVGEESQLTAAEDRLLRSPGTVNHQIPKPEVGLVIGKIHPDLNRASVYTIVPTPSPTDAGLPACDFVSATADQKKDDRRKKKKAASSMPTPPPAPLLIDTEWIAEHARQVSRMLLGGMDVVGIYVWAPEDSVKVSAPILLHTLKAVSDAAKPFHHDERLLLHISYSPRRWICRICSLTSTNTTTSNLRPCDFKMGKLLASLRCFTCTYNFQMRLPIFHELRNLQAFKDVIQIGINCIANELKSAKALIDGNLITEDSQCTSGGPHEVELLLPFMKETSELCSLAEVLGLVSFSGVICTSAYLSSKAPLSQVISDIKGDIITSLQSRLDIACEDTEADAVLPVTGKESSDSTLAQKIECDPNLSKARYPSSLLFPRRVYVPWFPNIFICDYLKQYETFEDVKDHCKEVLSMEISAGKNIEETEKEAIAVMGDSFWSFAGGIPVSAADRLMKRVDYYKGSHDHKSSHLSVFVLATTIVFLVISVFIAWLLNHSLFKDVSKS